MFLVRAVIGRTWLVVVATLVICSAFAARAVAALEAHEVLPPVVAAPAPVPTAQRSVPDGSELIARNIFCSTCAPAEILPTTKGASYSGKAAILIATAIGREAHATVRVIETEVQGDWGEGERIPGVGAITRIGPASVDVVDGNGVRTTLRLLEVLPDRSAGAATPASDPAAADPYADSIKKLDDSTYEVRRELVRELVTGVQKPGKVRMLPIVGKDGEVGGVRVYGVTAGSLPAALGMKSADVIDSINGEPIKSAQQLLDLYAKLDQLSTVQLGGKRGGKPLGLELRLR